MIVGHGDIASVLREVDRPNKIYFASGVSNSQETRESEYQRERKLLLDQDRVRQVVYFSSLAIFYAATRYTWHKRTMEDLVKTFPMHAIIRLGNITWGDNPNTFINYLRNRVKQGLPIEIRDVERYIVDKDEFLHWIKMIPDWNVEMNVPGRRMKVKDIVKKYVI